MLAVLAAYGMTLGHGFVDFDDDLYVRDNPWVLQGFTPQHFSSAVQWAFTTDTLANWHPVTWLSLMTDALVFGGRPWGFHLVNVLLHACNVLLVFGLLERMTRCTWRSAAVAALLAVHPMHVESVAWISERKDVLSLFLGLLTLRSYLDFRRDRDARSCILMLAWFAMGLMTKSMLVTLPFALLLLDFWPLGRFRPPSGGWRNFGVAALEKLPLLLLAVGSSWITFRVQVGSHQLEDGQWIPLPVRLANAAVSYVLYLEKLIWPVDLACLYPNPSHIGQPSWTAAEAWSAAGLLAAITIAALVSAKRRPWLIVGWLWFLGTLVPVIGLVQIGRHSMADRYAYLPYLGLYIAIAWEVGEWAARSPKAAVPAASALGAAILGCAVLAFNQVRYWKDSITLFERALAVTEDNWLIHNNLAAMYDQAGRHAEAIDQMHKAIKIYPQDAALWAALGGIHSKAGEWYDAQLAFEKVTDLKPKDAAGHKNLAAVLKERGRLREAETELKRALELDPDILSKPRKP